MAVTALNTTLFCDYGVKRKMNAIATISTKNKKKQEIINAHNVEASDSLSSFSCHHLRSHK